MTPLARLRAAMKACRAERFELDGLTESAPNRILEWVARRMSAWSGKGKEAVKARAVLSELEASARLRAYPNMGATIRHEYHQKAGQDCPGTCLICADYRAASVSQPSQVTARKRSKQ